MAQLLFRNFQLLEPEVGELQGGFELLVEGETVREVSDKPIKAAGADVIDCGGRTLMPGPDRQPRPRDPERGEHPLPRSRAADPDDGARRAADARACSIAASPRCATPAAPTGASRPRSSRADIPGPRLFIAGRAIGPTGGHSDARRRTDFGMRCHCCNAMRFGMRQSPTASPRCARPCASRCARAPTRSRS